MNNDFTNMERAEVLTAALPYIRKYTGQIVVVKYGGNAMINEQARKEAGVCRRPPCHGQGDHGYRPDGPCRQD